jgi:DNA-binding SARP family transcriptional activator
VQFGVLGPLQVLDDEGVPVDIGGPQPRKALAVLVAAAGHLVPVDALVEVIWAQAPPRSAGGTVQSYVSRIRRRLGDGTPLVYHLGAYRLDVAPDDVDFRRFEAHTAGGLELLEAGHADAAHRVLGEALALWRGPAFVDVTDVEAVAGLATRLEEVRMAALEGRIAADLALGRHAAVTGELAELVASNPFRETLHAHLALAQYRSGRQADALRTLDRVRRTLVDELGVGLGPALRELEAAVLRQDPELELGRGSDGGPPAVPPPPPAVAPSAGRFVGRARELATLTDLLDRATRGCTSP